MIVSTWSIHSSISFSLILLIPYPIDILSNRPKFSSYPDIAMGASINQTVSSSEQLRELIRLFHNEKYFANYQNGTPVLPSFCRIEWLSFSLCLFILSVSLQHNKQAGYMSSYTKVWIPL